MQSQVDPKSSRPAHPAEMLSSRLSEISDSKHKARSDKAIQQRVSRNRVWTRMRVTRHHHTHHPFPIVLQGPGACAGHRGLLPSPFTFSSQGQRRQIRKNILQPCVQIGDLSSVSASRACRSGDSHQGLAVSCLKQL